MQMHSAGRKVMVMDFLVAHHQRTHGPPWRLDHRRALEEITRKWGIRHSEPGPDDWTR